jgi:hypothetical protein
MLNQKIPIQKRRIAGLRFSLLEFRVLFTFLSQLLAFIWILVGLIRVHLVLVSESDYTVVLQSESEYTLCLTPSTPLLIVIYTLLE